MLVLAVLAFGLPWLSVHRDDIDALDGDPAERFSGSMRILRENTIADYDEDEPEPDDGEGLDVPEDEEAEDRDA